MTIQPTPPGHVPPPEIKVELPALLRESNGYTRALHLLECSGDLEGTLQVDFCGLPWRLKDPRKFTETSYKFTKATCFDNFFTHCKKETRLFHPSISNKVLILNMLRIPTRNFRSAPLLKSELPAWKSSISQVHLVISRSPIFRSAPLQKSRALLKKSNLWNPSNSQGAHCGERWPNQSTPPALTKKHRNQHTQCSIAIARVGLC